MKRAHFPARLQHLSPHLASGKSASPAASTTPVAHGLGLDSLGVRLRMVQDLKVREGIQDERVLQALQQVERHRFVDAALVHQAYEDTSLPIGLGQTISKPSVVARMLALLGANQAQARLGRVLEIGTGCGYQAALLSQMCKMVYSIERLKGLHDKALHNLQNLSLHNLHLRHGDGMQGWPEFAPFDGIIAAAGGEALPPAWLSQLAIGGRLVAPIHTSSHVQQLLVVDRTSQGFIQQTLEGVMFVPLKSGAE